MRPLARSCRPRGGFTLIEVLVAILVFSIGALGTIALQAKLLQSSTQNTDRARAAILGDELAAQMWALKTVSIDIPTLQKWQDRVSSSNASGLPNGSGSVSYAADSNGNQVATITITWKPTTVASGASSTNQYITTVVMP